MIFIDPTQELLEAKETTEIYHKWDTHWNEQAGYIEFSVLANVLGISDISQFLD